MLQTITINGWPCEYVEYGHTDKPSMILLHGWAQDHRLFRHLAPLLAEKYHVFALNFRGHDARLSRNDDFTAADLTDDVMAFMTDMGLSDVRFVSTSHGGWVNIAVQERLGTHAHGRTVVIDWLMQPTGDFLRLLQAGQEPGGIIPARQQLFSMWTEASEVIEVVDHVNREMTWFGEEMWVRAFREIEQSYQEWGNPLERMNSLGGKLKVAHIYSQPVSDAYQGMQEEYALTHPWFTPVRIPGLTHFPTLESPAEVAEAIMEYYES